MIYDTQSEWFRNFLLPKKTYTGNPFTDRVFYAYEHWSEESLADVLSWVMKGQISDLSEDPDFKSEIWELNLRKVARHLIQHGYTREDMKEHMESLRLRVVNGNYSLDPGFLKLVRDTMQHIEPDEKEFGLYSNVYVTRKRPT